jgi:hypothetical protein
MGCDSGIAKAIISNCTTQPIGGVEATAYLFNRNDMTITYDGTYTNKVTGIASVTDELLYQYSGVKKNINAGFDRVVAEDMADRFKHYAALKGFEFDSASVQNLDNLKDVCLIVEYKQKSDDGDGVFVGYGFKSGLYPTSDTRRAIENNAIRSIELASQDQEDEPHSEYNILITDYATTKAALIALLS